MFGFGGGQQGELTGYNAGQVTAVRDKVATISTKLGAKVEELFLKTLVKPMGAAWHAPEAVTYFASVKDAVAKSGAPITAVLNSFVDSLQSARENWAANTGGTSEVLTKIDELAITLDVTSITEEDGGKVYIEEVAAKNIAGKLGALEVELQTEFEKIALELQADAAFLGHGQADAIEACFKQINGELHKIFKFLTEGEGIKTGFTGGEA